MQYIITFSNADLSAFYGFIILLKLLPSYNTKAKGRISSEDGDKVLVTFYEVIN